jgi:hypothetical protein
LSVAKAIRHPGEEIGGRRGDDQEIRFARQADMADLVFGGQIEEIGIDAVLGQRADRKRRHELLGGLGHDRADLGAALAQAPDQIERLVGGDAAADNQKDPLIGDHGPVRAA